MAATKPGPWGHADSLLGVPKAHVEPEKAARITGLDALIVCVFVERDEHAGIGPWVRRVLQFRWVPRRVVEEPTVSTMLGVEGVFENPVLGLGVVLYIQNDPLRIAVMTTTKRSNDLVLANQGLRATIHIVRTASRRFESRSRMGQRPNEVHGQ